MNSTVRVPVRAFHTLRTVGRFPLPRRTFGDGYLSPTTHALHLHEYHGRWRCADREYVLAPGDLTLSVRGGRTDYELPRSGWHWCIHFEPVAKADTWIQVPIHRPAGQDLPLFTERLSAIATLYRAGQRGSLAAVAAAEAGFQELLLRLALPVVSVQPAKRLTRAAEAAAAKLEQGLANLLDVPALCRTLGVSQNRLAAAFRQRFGCTLARYQLARRIEHAEVLLRTTGRSVSDIGTLVGLSDPHHFNKLVRRETGMSPLQIRRGG